MDAAAPVEPNFKTSDIIMWTHNEKKNLAVEMSALQLFCIFLSFLFLEMIIVVADIDHRREETLVIVVLKHSVRQVGRN